MTRSGRTLRRTAGLALAMLAGAAAAQAPPAVPPAPKAKPAAPDPAFEAARTAFEALPEAERKGLQDALVWTGDYNSVVNGAFGRRSYEALQAHARRSGGTGLPDAAGQAALLKEAAAARKAAGFSVKPDPASGAVLGVPERILAKRTAQPGGTRWQSVDGRITLETKSYPPGETGLEAVFARLTAPAPERRVTYKLLRPDFLVVTAETAADKSYIRYAAGEAGLRGVTLGYDKALAGEVDRLAIAVANSFVPFPGAAPVTAPAPVAAAVPVLNPPPVAVARPAPAATGLVVAPGRVLTSAAALGPCGTPTVMGLPARIAKGAAGTDLMLLETGPLAGRAPVRPAFRAAPPAADEAVLALGLDAEGGVTVAPGQMVAGRARVTAPLQPGAGGAPVLDRSGALIGLVANFPSAPRRVAGVVPPASYGLVPAATVAAFLAELGPAGPPRTAGTPGAAVATLSGAVVAVACRS